MLPSALVRSTVLRNNAFAIRSLHTTAGNRWWSYPGWWFEDHKSRPWPRNEEERKAAAARYGLREGDYKPVKEDYYGGTGDYPDLGEVQYGVKDPYENWSYYKYRRNFNEPVMFDFDLHSPDRYVYTKIEKVGGWRLFLRYLLIYGGLFGGIYLVVEFPIKSIPPFKPKQFPYDYQYAGRAMNHKLFPLTHYTFEPGDEIAEEPKPQKGSYPHH